MPTWPKKNARAGVDRYGRSPLWQLAADGDAAGVSRELANEGDPNSPDDAGLTLLHIAAQNGHVEVIELLLQAGADPNRVDRKYGNGPLFTAVHQACLAVRTDANLTAVSLLLRHGADAHRKNNFGRSPLDRATASDDKVVLALFSGPPPVT